MTPQECANLVERIVQTWPNGPRGRIWTEALGNLDAGRAGTAYVRLRDEAEQPPTIGRYMAVYRSLEPHRTHHAQPDYGLAISFDEYIRRVTVRADSGDHAAQAELERWAQRAGERAEHDRVAYSPADAAAALGVTRQHIYALINRGQLRRFKIGRCTRIPVADVLALIGGDDARWHRTPIAATIPPADLFDDTQPQER